MKGISDHEIVDSFNKEENVNIQKNFVGAFPSNSINRFISYHSIT